MLNEVSKGREVQIEISEYLFAPNECCNDPTERKFIFAILSYGLMRVCQEISQYQTAPVTLIGVCGEKSAPQHIKPVIQSQPVSVSRMFLRCSRLTKSLQISRTSLSSFRTILNIVSNCNRIEKFLVFTHSWAWRGNGR